MTTIDKCPIWNCSHADNIPEYYSPTVSITQNKEGYEVNSQYTDGKYRISYQTCKKLKENPKFSRNSFKAKLTTWLIQQRKRGKESPQITNNVLEEVQQRSRLPIDERVNNVLQYIQEENEKNKKSECYQIILRAYSECATYDDWCMMLGELQKYVEVKGDEYLSEFFEITLNDRGLERLDSIETSTNNKQAFVAMWFDKSMDDIYDKSIQPAIEEMGYKPMRIDRKGHNNKIDDEIIAEIRRSKFLIADFSHGEDGIRGGVYYEAGFAYGLNIPVIFTCRKEDAGSLHFDIRQFNHIIWEHAKDLKEKLKHRIGATIGDGPHSQ